jgi:hypothetical protein
MNVADRFVVGLVELGRWHNQKHRATTNQKHKSKPATRLNHDEHEHNKATKNKDCGSKGYRTAERVYFF